MHVKVSWLDRQLIRLFGSILWLPPYLSRVPLYVFKCDIHGYVVAPAQGFYAKLVCPLCLGEKTVSDTILA